VPSYALWNRIASTDLGVFLVPVIAAPRSWFGTAAVAPLMALIRTNGRGANCEGQQRCGRNRFHEGHSSLQETYRCKLKDLANGIVCFQASF
jgi:hypothetical protein